MMRVAVIGVGVMGGSIAGRLLDGGAQLALYDRDPDACAVLAGRGATPAASAAEAAAQAEFVITSLNSAAIVDRAVFGPGGVAGTATPERLLVDMSSIDPAATAAMRKGCDGKPAWAGSMRRSRAGRPPPRGAR